MLHKLPVDAVQTGPSQRNLSPFDMVCGHPETFRIRLGCHDCQFSAPGHAMVRDWNTDIYLQWPACQGDRYLQNLRGQRNAQGSEQYVASLPLGTAACCLGG